MRPFQYAMRASMKIEKWLKDNNYKATTKTISDMTADFLKHKGLPYTRFNNRYKGLFTANLHNSETVLEYYDEFKQYVLTNYQPILPQS